jgi:hypothetical protein
MENVDFMLSWITRHAEWGYNEMGYPSVPVVRSKGGADPATDGNTNSYY